MKNVLLTRKGYNIRTDQFTEIGTISAKTIILVLLLSVISCWVCIWLLLPIEQRIFLVSCHLSMPVPVYSLYRICHPNDLIGKSVFYLNSEIR